MNCVTVRDRLTERALGTLPARERAGIDRHLVWCAACRKEAAEMESAAATSSRSVSTRPNPTPRSRTSVVAAINHASGRRPRTRLRAGPPRGRRGPRRDARRDRGLGWGAVMAGRAARSDEAALVTTLRQQSAAERFSRILSSGRVRRSGGRSVPRHARAFDRRWRWRQRAHPRLAHDHRHGRRARQRRAAQGGAQAPVHGAARRSQNGVALAVGPDRVARRRRAERSRGRNQPRSRRVRPRVVRDAQGRAVMAGPRHPSAGGLAESLTAHRRRSRARWVSSGPCDSG